jgi:uncharacterized protein YggE
LIHLTEGNEENEGQFPHRWSAASDLPYLRSLLFHIVDRNRLVQHLRMKSVLFPLFLLPILAFAKGGLPDKPYIYVEGNAEIQKPPDIVTLRAELVARAPEQLKANQDVQARANKIVALLKEKKVADNDIIAQNLRSEPEFEQEESYPNRRGKLIGYKVSRPFEIKIRDVAIFPKLVDDLIAIGNVEFLGIDPGLAKQNEMENELWDKALANARERTEKTLKPMNMKIDTVFAISPVPIPEISSTIFPKERAGFERVIVTGSNIPTAEEGAPSQCRLAPITVNQIVHVIYLIAPAK